MNIRDQKTIMEAYHTIVEAQQAQQQGGEACLSCGTPLRAGVKFCTKCGFITDVGWLNPATKQQFAQNYAEEHQAQQAAVQPQQQAAPQQPMSVDQQQDNLYNQQAAQFMQNFGKPRA